MLKRLLAMLCVLACAEIYAEQYDVDGDFQVRREDGTSGTWAMHNWNGYLPAPEITVAEEDGVNFLKVRKIVSEYGTTVHYNKNLPGRAGDQVRVSFRARGKGILSAGLYFYSEKHGWNQNGQFKKITLMKDWADYVYSFDVLDGKSGPTGFFHACISAKKDTEFDLTAVKVELEPGEFRGSFPFPKEWKVFGDVPKELAPDSLTAVPESLGDKKAVSVPLRGGVLDFIPVMGAGARKCAWAFATLDSPIDCEYSIGAGADWWMTYYLNGEEIFNTFPGGNVQSPISFNNYVKTVRLQKGQNVFAVKFMSGSGSSNLFMAGPQEMRKTAVKFHLDKIWWIENFDGVEVACSGNPELIKGNPTPGLLSITGQGVFSTSGKLMIRPAVDKAIVPTERDRYLVQSLRIQKFGREDDKRNDSTLSYVFAGEKDSFRLEVQHRAARGLLLLNAIDQNGPVASFEVPYHLLPADILVAANGIGKVCIAVNSLVDSSRQFFSCESSFFAGLNDVKPSLEFQNDAKDVASIVVDNYIVGAAADDSDRLHIPYKVELLPEFDPVKAGWKMVWNDEFDGDKVDLSKWELTGDKKNDRVQLKDGKCIITADWENEKKEKVTSVSLWSLQRFQYGYFEARVKFRKEHGWWSAFWLCTRACANPFVDGFEIDIYEDYYLRSLEPGGEPRDILDHNLHIFSGGVLKSNNYNSHLTGGLDQYYNIGCKWTPFEISYYLDGKLIASKAGHSPYNSVTFDSFYHSAGTTPLSAILSGCCGMSGGNPKDGNFPESFYVDYVRVYEYPHDEDPTVKLISKDDGSLMVPPGTILQFEAEALPNEKTASPIQAAYIFDSGALLDYKTEPPYKFEVPLTKEFYDTTAWVKPGRSGQRLEFGCQLHAYSIFVQDANGRVANTPVVQKFVTPSQDSTPYKGKAQVLPGKLRVVDFDDGGPNIAYSDSTPGNSFLKPGEKKDWRDTDVDISGDTIGGVSPWEWIRYTVDIQKAGTYRATLHYGTPFKDNGDFMILVDGAYLGAFQIRAHEAYHWGVDTEDSIEFKLPAGRHVITTIPKGSSFNYNGIDFELIAE